MRTVERDIVGALIFSQDEALLLGLAHPENGVYGGEWVVPAGGVEPGETRDEAVVREVLEETGVDISELDVCLVGSGDSDTRPKLLKEANEVVQFKMNFFQYEVRLGELATAVLLKPNEEFAELRWYARTDLSELPLSHPTRAILEKLQYIPQV